MEISRFVDNLIAVQGRFVRGSEFPLGMTRASLMDALRREFTRRDLYPAITFSPTKGVKVLLVTPEPDQMTFRESNSAMFGG